MGGILDQFRKNVMTSVWKERTPQDVKPNVDDKIALGVLLWVVAQADDQFLPEEKSKIEEILLSYGKVAQEDIPIVLQSIEQAAHGYC